MSIMNIRPGGPSGLQLAYAVGRIAGDGDAFVVNQLGGESPLGATLCSPGSQYSVFLNPDGSGRSARAGLELTSSRGDGKACYIRDSQTGESWSPFFLPTCEIADEYEVTYLPGRASIFTLKHKIACTFTVAVVPGGTCEIWHVRLENRSAASRTLTFTTYAEPSLGPEMETGYMDRHKALLLGRPLSAADDDSHAARETVIFHSSTLTPTAFETEKSRFTGDGRTLRNPEYLDSSEHAGEDGTSQEAIASLTVEVEVPIEGEAEFAFCFGVASSAEEALRTVNAFSGVSAARAAIESTLGHWQDVASTVSVKSQDSIFDALVNTWLPYEAYAGWVRQRTGGVCLDPSRAADALRRLYALTATCPQECRESLLAFAGGISLMGTYSPDRESQVMLPISEMLWLPACAARYLAETGDIGVLLEEVPAADGPRLTLREHCERIMRMCIASGEPASGLLQRTVRQWALTDAGSPEFAAYLDMLSKRTLEKREGPSEDRSLPRRVRYFQSLTPVLAEQGPAADELGRVYESEFAPDGDSGAACCAYAVLVEHVLGLEPTAQGLRIHPALPPSWQECEVTRHFRDDTYVINMKRSQQPGKSAVSIVVDGEPVLGDMLPYFGDGLLHRVEVTVRV